MRMRLAAVLAVLMCLCLGGGSTCRAEGTPVIDVFCYDTHIRISVDGNLMEFPNQAPCLSNDRTMVPLKFISEALGADVDWDEAGTKVVVKGARLIELALDSGEASIDGTVSQLEAPTAASGQRVMVPLRFIAEALGAEVRYNPGGDFRLYRPAWRVDVSVSEQKVRVYDGDTLVKDWTASTGANGSTPMGTFLLQNRGEWFFNPKYQQGAQWWVSFKDWGTYLFHSIPMDRQGTVIDEEAAKLGMAVSHGCVRLATEDAQWLYRHIPSGTPVSIHA